MDADFFQHFALAGLVTFALLVILQHRNAKRDKSVNTSMSNQATKNKRSFITLLVGGMLTGIFIVGYILGFLLPDTAVSNIFYVLFTISVVCLIVTLLTPDKGKTKLTHHWSSYGMTFLFMPMTALLFVDSYENIENTSNRLTSLDQFIGISLTLLLVIGWIYRQSPKATVKQKFLFQQLYFAAFLFALTVRAYS